MQVRKLNNYSRLIQTLLTPPSPLGHWLPLSYAISRFRRRLAERCKVDGAEHVEPQHFEHLQADGAAFALRVVHY